MCISREDRPLRLFTSREIATLGGKVHEKADVAGLAVELHQLGLEVAAPLVHGLLDAFQVTRGESAVPI